MKSKIYRVKGELELEEMGNGDYTLWFRQNAVHDFSRPSSLQKRLSRNGKLSFGLSV